MYHPQSKVTSQGQDTKLIPLHGDAQCRQVRKAVRDVRHRNGGGPLKRTWRKEQPEGTVRDKDESHMKWTKEMRENRGGN